MFTHIIIASLALFLIIVCVYARIVSYRLEKKRLSLERKILRTAATGLQISVPGRGWVNADKYSGFGLVKPSQPWPRR